MELMGEAIKVARRKAEAMAAGLGRKLGAASAATSGELKNLTRAMGLAPTDMRYSRSPSRADANRPDFLAIDILKLAQPVDVIFRLK